ncbi:polyphosphate:AMP phosphotransferase [bacterium]|nr:polyphosphate:AMP phosphotransferase [bacterium]
MFETAELGRKVSKEEYQQRALALRESLLLAQSRLFSADFPVIVLFAGVDGAGKGETVNLLNGWMDPRWIVTRAFDEPSEEESERPEFWRFWRALAPKGQIGLLLSAWYSRPLLERAHDSSAGKFEAALDEILAFERTLTDDGALIVKFWMHLGKREQEKRLKSLEKDPLQSWRVTKKDWKNWRIYGRFVAAAERIITRTSTGDAPWHIIEGADHRYRSLRAGTLLLEAIEGRLTEGGRIEGQGSEQKAAVPAMSKPEAVASPAPEKPAAPVTILGRLDMSEKLAKKDYRELLEKYQGRLNALHRKARQRSMSTILVFEGWDAAGKGGAIRRLTAALDARSVQVIPIAAPTDEERAQHYLWRFWRHLPRAGRVTVFDRSWYGRVLVERVEGFAPESQWRRAFAEINLFEQQLIAHGIVLLKFWLHITKEEQQRRFEERQKTSYKRWKLTDEDWRNRERWEDYELAAHDMVERTSTQEAPWILVEANDKRFARIKVLRSVCDALETAVAKAPRATLVSKKSEKAA